MESAAGRDKRVDRLLRSVALRWEGGEGGIELVLAKVKHGSGKGQGDETGSLFTTPDREGVVDCKYVNIAPKSAGRRECHTIETAKILTKPPFAGTTVLDSKVYTNRRTTSTADRYR